MVDHVTPLMVSHDQPQSTETVICQLLRLILLVLGYDYLAGVPRVPKEGVEGRGLKESFQD